MRYLLFIKGDGRGHITQGKTDTTLLDFTQRGQGL
jgi:hypothetical protein